MPIVSGNLAAKYELKMTLNDWSDVCYISNLFQTHHQTLNDGSDVYFESISDPSSDIK